MKIWGFIKAKLDWYDDCQVGTTYLAQFYNK